MPSPRTCSHVKINGIKCGSPALKYHTLCYFHYQWRHRRAHPYHFDRKEGWTTMTLPPLESKASILFAISEIQSSLLTGSIDFRTAKALFYGIQLAIQLKATDEELGAQETPDTCRELAEELEKARWAHRRPPQLICDSCPHACTSDDTCVHSTEHIRELERTHEPDRYARQCKDEEHEKQIQQHNQEIWDQKMAEMNASQHPTSISLEGARLQPCRKDERNTGALAPEVTTTSSATASITTALNPCHGERSAAVSREVEPPFVSSTQAPTPTSTQPSPEAPTLPLESSPARQSGESEQNHNTSRATARRQISDRKLFRSPAQFTRLESRALNEINILKSNS